MLLVVTPESATANTDALLVEWAVKILTSCLKVLVPLSAIGKLYRVLLVCEALLWSQTADQTPS